MFVVKWNRLRNWISFLLKVLPVYVCQVVRECVSNWTATLRNWRLLLGVVCVSPYTPLLTPYASALKRVRSIIGWGKFVYVEVHVCVHVRACTYSSHVALLRCCAVYLCIDRVSIVIVADVLGVQRDAQTSRGGLVRPMRQSMKDCIYFCVMVVDLRNSGCPITASHSRLKSQHGPRITRLPSHVKCICCCLGIWMTRVSRW